MPSLSEEEDSHESRASCPPLALSPPPQQRRDANYTKFDSDGDGARNISATPWWTTSYLVVFSANLIRNNLRNKKGRHKMRTMRSSFVFGSIMYCLGIGWEVEFPRGKQN